MSGQSTYDGYFTPMAAASLDDDAPVSTARAWVLQQNIQHLIDMSPQHRINWAGGVDNDDQFLIAGASDRTYYWAYEFAHTWLNDLRPCGFDVLIHGRTPAGTLELEARVVPAISSVWDQSVDPYWTDSGSTASASSVEVISSIFHPGTATFPHLGWRSLRIVEDGHARGVNVCFSRLEVMMTVPASEGGGLTGVSLREFC